MAYPAVQARSGGLIDTNSTSHAITLPADIQAGELLVVLMSIDQNPAVSIDTTASGDNWTKQHEQNYSTALKAAYFWKIAEGSDVLTINTDSAQCSAHISFRISGGYGAYGNTPNYFSGQNSDAFSFTGPNGVQDYLWIAWRAGDQTTQPSVAPTGYSNMTTQTTTNSTDGVSIASAEKNVHAASENPGPWTVTSEQYVVYGICITPVEPPAALTASVTETTAAANDIQSDIKGQYPSQTDEANANDIPNRIRTSVLSEISETAANDIPNRLAVLVRIIIEEVSSNDIQDATKVPGQTGVLADDTDITSDSTIITADGGGDAGTSLLVEEFPFNDIQSILLTVIRSLTESANANDVVSSFITKVVERIESTGITADSGDTVDDMGGIEVVIIRQAETTESEVVNSISSASGITTSGTTESEEINDISSSLVISIPITIESEQVNAINTVSGVLNSGLIESITINIIEDSDAENAAEASTIEVEVFNEVITVSGVLNSSLTESEQINDINQGGRLIEPEITESEVINTVEGSLRIVDAIITESEQINAITNREGASNSIEAVESESLNDEVSVLLVINSAEVTETTGEDIIHPDYILDIVRDITESEVINEVCSATLVMVAGVTESEHTDDQDILILILLKTLIESTYANSLEDSDVINITGRILEFTAANDICSARSGVQLIHNSPGIAQGIIVTQADAVILRKDNYD